MASIKSKKEIQLAAFTFLRALEQQEISTIEGQFFPVDPNCLYQKHQYTLGCCLIMGALCLFLPFIGIREEISYYDQQNFLIIIFTVGWLSLVGIFAWSLQQYLKTRRHLKTALNNPQSSSFGVLITEEYYFERSTDHYHIIPKANIVRIDYEEQRNNGETYLELLLDLEEVYEIRGILYRPEEYDIKSWIGQPTLVSASTS